MTSDSPEPPPGTAAESPEIDLGRLPRRRRSNRAETYVLVLVLALAIGAFVLPVTKLLHDSRFFYWDWTDWHGIHAAHARGEAAFGAGDYQTAIKAYTRALAKREPDPAARFNRAQAEFAAGQFQAAILDYSWVLEHGYGYDSDRIDRICRLKRTLAREQTGDFTGAANDRQEITDDPLTVEEATELVPFLQPAIESY